MITTVFVAVGVAVLGGVLIASGMPFWHAIRAAYDYQKLEESLKFLREINLHLEQENRDLAFKCRTYEYRLGSRKDYWPDPASRGVKPGNWWGRSY